MLTRGLLQTQIPNALRNDGSRSKFSPAVVLSALFFGAMHLVLLKSMASFALPIIVLNVLLGLVAERYREAIGSFIPAIVVHALFNMGGMLPLCLIRLARS